MIRVFVSADRLVWLSRTLEFLVVEMVGSLTIHECASGAACKGVSRPALLRDSDLRHAESIRTGFCSECRRHYGDKLPQLSSPASAFPPLEGGKAEAGEITLSVSTSRIASVVPKFIEEQDSIITEDDLRLIKDHNALVDLALIADEEEDLIDSPLGAMAVLPLSQAQETRRQLFESISDEDSSLDASSRQSKQSDLPDEEDDAEGRPLLTSSPFKDIFSAGKGKAIGKNLSGLKVADSDLSSHVAKLETAKTESKEVKKEDTRQPSQPILPSLPARLSFEKVDSLAGESMVLAADIAPEMSPAYREELLAAAATLQGPSTSPVLDSGDSALDLKDAASLVAADARKNNLLHVDLIDASENFNGIIERHRNPDIAAIAAALMLNENPLVVDAGGGSIEAIIRAAQEEDMEYHVVKAAGKEASRTVVEASLRTLILQLSKFPEQTTRGRVVIVTDLVQASASFKREFIEAVVSRKIGNYPVPAGVRIAIAESSSFETEDFPPELIMQSIVISVKSRDNSAAEELLNATESRRRLFEQQIKQAEEAGNTARADKLRELAKKPGYVGAWRPGPGSDSSGASRASGAAQASVLGIPRAANGTAFSAESPKDGKVDVDSVVDSLVAKNGGYSRHDKAALITDITEPSRSKFRRQVAEKLLTGVYGRDFASNAIANYLKHSSGPLAGKATIEDVIAGLSTVDEVKKTLAAGESAYSTFIAIELRISPVVDGVMKRGGDEAYKLRQIFLAVADLDQRTAAAIAKDRPYFIKMKA